MASDGNLPSVIVRATSPFYFCFCFCFFLCSVLDSVFNDCCREAVTKSLLFLNWKSIYFRWPMFLFRLACHCVFAEWFSKEGRGAIQITTVLGKKTCPQGLLLWHCSRGASVTYAHKQGECVCCSLWTCLGSPLCCQTVCQCQAPCRSKNSVTLFRGRPLNPISYAESPRLADKFGNKFAGPWRLLKISRRCPRRHG